MKVLYHIPSLQSIYAQRTIYHGYRNAFLDLGHEFKPLTADNDPKEVFEKFRPDLFITSSHFYFRKFLDFEVVKKYRKLGMFTLVKVDFWRSPMAKCRINEAPSLQKDKVAIDLMRRDLFGDAYFHVVEQEDSRMEGFEQGVGSPFYTIPLAADSTILHPIPDKRYEADISYIGTYLPEKRDFFREHVFPLRKKYKLRLYGQDWTLLDRGLGWVQRAGQYFNVPVLRSLRKPKLCLDDEARVYASSVISINVHEQYQHKYGGDCNERTFKIPLSGGFEVVDDVACIRRYFVPGKEMVVADGREDWIDKVKHYLENPHERLSIIQAGRERVLRDHTYHNRVKQILTIQQNGVL